MRRPRDRTYKDKSAPSKGHNCTIAGPGDPNLSVIPPDRVQGLVRLLSDTINANGDRAQGKRQMLSGLCQLLNGEIWIWTQLKDFRPGILPASPRSIGRCCTWP
jgi:hypothetical protein